MKIAFLAFLFLGVVFMSSDACRIRCHYRFVFRRICCPWRLQIIRFRLCFRFGCGKRSPEPAVEVGFPSNFTEYDKNNDGFISKSEFFATVKMSPTEPGLLQDFKRADKNNDGKLDCKEFLNSGFEFEQPPHGCKSSGDNDEAEYEAWSLE